MASLKWISSRGRWRVRWHISAADGTVVKGSKCFRFKSDARDYREVIQRKEHRLKSGLTKPSELIVRARDKWLSYNQRHTDRTQQHYRAVITAFLEGLPSKVADIRQISAKHVQAYISGLLDAGRVNRTANGHLTAIKSFCGWLASQYDIHNAAEKSKMLKEDPPESRVLKRDEYIAVVKAADGPARDVVVFLGNTGLRATEFCQLTWDCVGEDFARLRTVGKGRKLRTVPLNETCRDILARLKPQNAKPKDSIQFIKSRLYRKKLYDICETLARKAGVPVFGPHAIRHYFATELLRRDVPVYRVSKILGHSSIRTTETIYLHWLPEDSDGVTDCLLPAIT